MIVRDNPESMAAGGLTNYMTKNGHSIKASHGQEMTDEEVERFHDRSEEEGFTRHLILAPERSDLSDEELDQAARESMAEWYENEDMQDMEFCYSIHNDQGNSHVHVAATASKESGDLWVDSTRDNNKITRLRDDIAADRFRDHSTERQQQMMVEQDREAELVAERAEAAAASGDDSLDLEVDLGSDLDLDAGLDHQQDDPLAAIKIARSATPDRDGSPLIGPDLETYDEHEQDRNHNRDRRR